MPTAAEKWGEMKGRPAEGREGLLRPCWLCLLLQAKKEAEREKTKDDDAADEEEALLFSSS